MKEFALRLSFAMMALAATTAPVLAKPHQLGGGLRNFGGRVQPGPHTNNFVTVPEIDAATGIVALAAVLAALAFAWEIRRRRHAY